MKSMADKDRETARKKGLAASAATAGSVALMVVGMPVLGAIALIPSAYLVKDWFSFRAKRGMRF
jgi:hypothetical protein